MHFHPAELPRLCLCAIRLPFLPRYHDQDLDDGCQQLSISRAAEMNQGAATDNVIIDNGAVRRFDHPASTSRIREERLRAWVEYQDVLGPGGGSGGGGGKPEVSPPGGENGKPGNIGDGGGAKSKSDRRETDRGSYREYGGIGVLVLDVWANQSWKLDERGMATAKGGDEGGPGFHPRALLSKR